jgi:hypothetical protein
VCFPNANSIVCSSYATPTSGPFDPQAIPNVALVDSLVGWEQQKFLIMWTYVYLPENQKRYWLDRLELKELGISSNPDWSPRIELHLPGGSTYIARTFGTEDLFGKTVQKGIAARVLEYANSLMVKAYQGQWYNKDGVVPNQNDPGPDAWWVADLDPADGQPIVNFDPNMVALASNGTQAPPKPGCAAVDDNLNCTCEENKACLMLDKYKSLPWFLARMDSWIHVGAKGLYPEAL